MPDFSAEIRGALAPLSLEPAREAEIVEELSQHLVDRHDELVAQGSSPEEAERTLREDVWSGRLTAGLREAALPRPRPPVAVAGEEGGGPFQGLWRDLRYAARQLRLQPTFTLVAVLSLALGTGANTAIFQLVDAVRLRALPVPQPEELAIIRIPPGSRTGATSGRVPYLTHAHWERIQERQQGFRSLAAWGTEPFELSQSGESRLAEGIWVSGGFFETLGVTAAAGRLLTPADDRPGCGAPGVVLSHAFWKREYGADPAAIGRVLNLDRRPFEILGVSRAGFFGPEVGRAFDVALPICSEALLHAEEPRAKDLQFWWLAAIGRLKPGWTVQSAAAQLDAISPPIFRETLPASYDPQDRKSYLSFRLTALPGATGVSSVRRAYERPLWLLMGISALVLLIACANLANLMLARAGARRREMAVRFALGASRARVIRQLLVESLLLASIGTLCGAGLAQVLTRSLVGFLSGGSTPVFVDLSPDASVLLFTAALAVGTCLLFGLTPAREASRTSPSEALQTSARSVAGGSGGFGLRRALVVAQVALSLVLLFGALLFVGTFRNLVTLDAGYSRESVLNVRVNLAPYDHPLEQRAGVNQQLLERLSSLPGVVSAAAVDIVPLSGNLWNEVIRTEGSPAQAGAPRQIANFNRVTPNYFRTMETPFLAGRDFDARDTLGAPLVAVVTEAFARQFLNGANPVGKTVSHATQPGKPDAVYQIVGMVKDIKYRDLREEFTPLVYLPIAQDEAPGRGINALLRTTLPAEAASASVKAAVAEAYPAALLRLRTFESIANEALSRERLMATLSGFFGVLAGVLAMVGLYGVVSYMVTRRRNEIGVRMALGADRRAIVSMVMREAGSLLAIGLGAGTVLAILGALAARALLYGLTPGDPRTIATAVAALGGVAAIASFLPARRAASVDPVQALRE